MISELRNKGLIILLLLGLAIKIKAQEANTYEKPGNNLWRLQAGVALFGSNDVGGYSIAAEYNRYPKKKLFRFGPVLKFSSARRTSEQQFLINNQVIMSATNYSATVVEAGVNGYFEMVDDYGFAGIELGLGSFYRYAHETVATGAFTTYSSKDFTVPPNSVGQKSFHSIGFNFIVGLFFQVSSAVRLNLTGLLHADSRSNNGFGLLAGMSVML